MRRSAEDRRANSHWWSRKFYFKGGVHPKLKISGTRACRHISKHYPSITIHGFSAVEIDYIARISKISTKRGLKTPKRKGPILDARGWSGDLSDRVRDHCAKKCDTADWLRIHKEEHELGMKTTATMMFGTVESTREIVGTGEHIRNLQDETADLRAFILWSFQGAKYKAHARISRDQKAKPQRLSKASAVLKGSFWITLKYPKQLGHAGQLRRPV